MTRTRVELCMDNLKDMRYESGGYVAYTNGKGVRLEYPDSFSMMNDLPILICTVKGNPDGAECLTNAVVKEGTAPETAKTIEEVFDEALEYSLLDPDSRKEKKEPAFILEVWNLLDALEIAKENGPSGEELFQEFLDVIGFWWVAHLCDVSRALKMLRKFFDTWTAQI